jgi:hypothetical protein
LIELAKRYKKQLIILGISFVVGFIAGALF